jgi:exosortase/archaeosortase family protein
MLRQHVLPRRLVETAAETVRTRVPTWLLLVLALFPPAFWYARRLNDGSDEPYGLIPLILVGLFAWRDRKTGFKPVPEGGLPACRVGRSPAHAAGSLMILLSVLLIPHAPPMLRAALALAGAGFMLGLHGRPALLGLLALSLPVVASLQFYAGYPMRLATAEGAVRVLQLFGVTVERSGVGLDLAGSLIGVDPACAGVRMLWQGLIAAMALAAYHRLSWLATGVAACAAMALVIPANIARAAWLALDECGRIPFSGIGHSTVGLIAFLAILLPLAVWIPRHAGKPQAASTPGQSPIARPALACACLLAPILLLGPSRAAPEQLPLGGEMPDTFTFDGVTLPLQPMRPTAEENAFAQAFPGSIGVFRRDRDQVILRRVTQATRRLHPSADCLRAAGYLTGDSITVKLGDGSVWSKFHATRNGVRLTVHERIVSETNADTWTDIPAWFWSALDRPLNGPWRAETVISR